MFNFHTFVLQKWNEKKSMPSVRKRSRKFCGQEKEKTSKDSRAYFQMRVKIKEGIEIKRKESWEKCKMELLLLIFSKTAQRSNKDDLVSKLFGH